MNELNREVNGKTNEWRTATTARTKIIAEILIRAEEDLPEEISSQKPERFAEDYEEIVQVYVHSKATLQEVFRRL